MDSLMYLMHLVHLPEKMNQLLRQSPIFVSFPSPLFIFYAQLFPLALKPCATIKTTSSYLKAV